MDRDNTLKRETNPRETANIFSFLSFFYSLQLFKKGYSKSLEMEDIYEVVPDCRSKQLGDRLEKQWTIEENKTRKPSVCRALWGCFGKTFICLGLIQFVSTVVKTIWSPRALSKLISYFNPGQTDLTKQDAYYYACMVISLSVLDLIVKNNYKLAASQLAVRIKAAVSTLLYRKSLKLGNEALSEITAGKIITITSKDLDIVETVITEGNDIWIALLQTALICYLIYCQIGIASLSGIVFFFVVLPIQVLLGKLAYTFKLKSSKKSDERLEFLKEVLSAIKIIKMYTWEQFFETKINDTRKEELKEIYKLYYAKIGIIVIGNVSTKVAFFIFLMTYIWLGNDISAEVVYYILSCFKDLEASLNITMPFGISYLAEMFATTKRIESVLKSKELGPVHKDIDCIEPKLILSNTTVKIRDKVVLNNVSLTLSSGLHVVLGPVGSGKTTFLKTILRETEFSGELRIFGKISFASQEPWLFPSTIKNNILFGEEFFPGRYNKILQICNLNHDLNLLPEGDNTLIGDRGLNLSKGQQARINLARALYREGDIYLLDDCLAALDAHVSDSIFQECICKFLKNKICIFVTNNSDYTQNADNIIVLEGGSVKIEKKIKLEEKLLELEALNKTTESEENQVVVKSDQNQIYHEVKKSGKVPLRDYHQYIIYGGGLTIFCVLMGLFVATQSMASFSEKILSKWVTLQQNLTSGKELNKTNIAEPKSNEKNNFLAIYAIAVIFSILLSLVRSFSFFFFTRKASFNIHKAMVCNIVNSTMQFFDSHLIGNVLNRFSKDFATVDELLPFVVIECMIIILEVVGSIALLTTVHYVFLLEASFVLFLACVVKQFCQPTGRNLERLHILARSPIIGHMSTSLEGLTTIRASNAQDVVKKEFERHQDLFSSAYLMVITTFKALNFFMELVCVVFFGVVLLQFLATDLDASVGDVGLVITQSLATVTTFTLAMINIADCENLMISVERVLEYTKLQEEPKDGKIIDNWPKRGLVAFNNVSLKYASNKQMLKNVNFEIAPKEKLGLVGRTGAGKSSIISALFRLYETEGSVTIDNTDIREVSLNLLRSRITVIPQDPYLFIGTIRENLDPLGQHSDDKIWKILKDLQLDSLIDNLNSQIDKGSNFSAGQKQLLCLARAVLRKSNILVLDEATANVDPETDTLIEESVKRHFADSTVIVVAHRLLSVMNCNKVVVMSDGRVSEFDEPEKLLKDGNSFFRSVIK
ncbi:probable multidrug resistance-associated protein lethal(2)03659 isoform X1 [Tribolium castaneum]|nr:PREDICTED: probable multidrug resistance-associated protein lethal(2)03659 isoform X1 [Tribolium castaneum]|eukprot:XP_015836093.1 PREDICTED: probable multidrug resistance-associated protein lethal(2)03659 isoform X1 [Tribolium castaneum]